ncbi:8285_t:CDS:2 [Ambispora leptoticha]|uniref:8285_t:CDS:1 n=1 Tax=Ambispora leptoticha TaxID=144679 RepID=A0A9N9CJ33_9GLOM|nr:8285_t:CDS:2 [Ambispora leptoticha]
METIRSKGSFEYALFEVSKLSGEVYSPPFATSDDMFWQLKFVPSYKEDPDYFSLFLCAIPNGEEEHLTTSWSRRSQVSATLYLRTPLLYQSDTIVSSPYVKSFTIGMDNFCSKWAGYGLNRFYKKSLLPDEFILGVDFDKTIFRPLAQAGPLPVIPIPDNLIKAWTSQLNKVETADVQFNVQGQIIYAHSSILSKRSEYFQKLFQQKWSEYQKKALKSEATFVPGNIASSESSNFGALSNKELMDQIGSFNSNSSNIASTSSTFLTTSGTSTNNIPSSLKYYIEVTDFHHITFLEMLQFLYTDRVVFEKRETSHKTALALFSIADKYLITDLRQRAKAKLCRDLNDGNAAELLFGVAWKWPDIKDHVVKYVVENFARVRKSEGFERINANPTNYPRLGELMLELLPYLVPEEKAKE